MENLKRIREPLAWVLIVLATLRLLLIALQLWSLTTDPEMGALASWVFNVQTVDYGMAVAMVVAVVGCAASPAVPRVRRLALVAAWVATLTVLLPWLMVLYSLLVGPEASLSWVMESLEWLWLAVVRIVADAGLGVIAAIALWAVALAPRGQVAEEDEADGEIEAEPEPVAADPDEIEAEHPTVWKPGEATGTVWRTADEAAAGAPGTRSLHSPQQAGSASEWAHDAEPGVAAPSEDWRPPSGS